MCRSRWQQFQDAILTTAVPDNELPTGTPEPISVEKSEPPAGPSEMKAPPAERLLLRLAALSHRTELAVGCYCEDETRCHRSLLRALLAEKGAAID